MVLEHFCAENATNPNSESLAHRNCRHSVQLLHLLIHVHRNHLLRQFQNFKYSHGNPFSNFGKFLFSEMQTEMVSWMQQRFSELEKLASGRSAMVIAENGGLPNQSRLR